MNRNPPLKIGAANRLELFAHNSSTDRSLWSIHLCGCLALEPGDPLGDKGGADFFVRLRSTRGLERAWDRAGAWALRTHDHRRLAKLRIRVERVVCWLNVSKVPSSRYHNRRKRFSLIAGIYNFERALS